jgi:hypothetical protein
MANNEKSNLLLKIIKNQQTSYYSFSLHQNRKRGILLPDIRPDNQDISTTAELALCEYLLPNKYQIAYNPLVFQLDSFYPPGFF